MGYSNKVYILANAELKNRKSKAEKEQRLHYGEAVLRIPELISIEKEISSAGLDLVKAVGMGQDAQKYIEGLAKKNLAAQKKRTELLAAAGFPKDYLEVKYSCQKCLDTGFVEGYRCSCYGELLKSLAYSELCESIPSGADGFSTFKLGYYPKGIDSKTGASPYERMRSIFEFCKSYAGDFDCDSPSLLMTGETGLGKTHLSLAIAAAAVNKGFGVIYGSAQNLLNKIEREHFDRRTDDEDTVAVLLDCDLLILDDLGSEFSTQFTVSVIYNIINTRLLKELPVIISTNLSVEELEKRYSRRVTSRIIGNYITLAFFGSDVRQILKKED